MVVAVQRGTSIEFDQMLAQGTAVALTEALRPVLSADPVLSTDGNAAYWTVAKALGVASVLSPPTMATAAMAFGMYRVSTATTPASKPG